jgi:iron(III) transport system ATP-binding protein
MVFNLLNSTDGNSACAIESGQSHLHLKKVFKSFEKGKPAVSGITIDIQKGEFLSLLGPSGCGKTTILRMIAGLEVPSSGIIEIDETVVAGTAWVPPEKRGIGLVFQDYALFPHMSVFKNIAFGLVKCSKGEIDKRVHKMLEIIGLPEVVNRFPHELSGGQQQRIALARALAPAPGLLLLDEPFSNLDADLRYELRTETKRIQAETGTTTILVTHDQEEAFSLSDRVGVLQDGRLEQLGTPYEIYHKPKNRFVADFVGRSDFVGGRIEGNSLISEVGTFSLPDNRTGTAKTVEMMIRPDDVVFTPDNKGTAVIKSAQFLGPEILYQIQLGDGKVIHSIRASSKKVPIGSKVVINIDPAHVVVFPAVP